MVPRWRDSCSAVSLEKLLHARCRNRQLSSRQARYSCWEVLFGHIHLVLLSLAMLALSYLGWLRASITHQEKRKLALQTCACVLPCVLLARAMGGLLLADALITV